MKEVTNEEKDVPQQTEIDEVTVKNENNKNETSPGRELLKSWLNKQMKIVMSDGRILIGIFLCTDRDGNIILGSCKEYIDPEAWGFNDEQRMLGLVMIPGKHIVSVFHDETSNNIISLMPMMLLE